MNLEQAQFEIEALQRRLAEYAGELERVRAQCAAMRGALEHIREYGESECKQRCEAFKPYGRHAPECPDEYIETATAALSTDAGKGFVSAEEHEEEKRRAFIAGEDEADGDWLAAIQSQDWGGEISLAEGNEIASDGRNEIIASIHERFEELQKNTVSADKARVIAEALRKAFQYFRDQHPSWGPNSLMGKVDSALTIARELGLLSIPTVAATGKPITPEELEDKL